MLRILPFFTLAAYAALMLLSATMAGAAEKSGGSGVAAYKIGNITVTALQDRASEMDVALFSGPATPEERLTYMPGGKTPASVNAFLIQVDGKNILADTGYGTLGTGKSMLPENLANAGIDPASIDLVILTHMHMDHIGGLLTHKKRAFPKARVIAAKPEVEYWMSLAGSKAGKAANERAQSNADLVKTVADVYGADFLTPFASGDEVAPGVTAKAAPGHTPGHTTFLVESEGRSLLIVGDLLHAAALQFPLPDECARYDMDPAKAAESRKAILAFAAEQGIPVAGMHIPFSGVGMVTADGKGFAFTARDR